MILPTGTILASGPVIIEDGRVLLNREKKRDNAIGETLLMFPGGGVEEFDKDLEATCHREVQEEMGIEIEIIKPLRSLFVDRIDQTGKAILVHFLAKRIGEIKSGDDILEWGWFDINNLPSNCAPNVYDIINDFKKA